MINWNAFLFFFFACFLFLDLYKSKKTFKYIHSMIKKNSNEKLLALLDIVIDTYINK
jgi:hypothetical protein